MSNPAKFRRWLLAIALSLSLPTLVQADLAGLPIELGPQGAGPTVAQVPNNSAWQISVQQEGVKEGTESRRLSYDLLPQHAREGNAFSNGIQRMEIETFSGSRWVQYIIRDHIIFYRPESNTVVVLTPEQLAQEGLSFKAGELPEAAWIRSEHYQGRTTYRGVVCDVFRQQENEPTKEDWIVEESSAPPVEQKLTKRERRRSSASRIALINRETRLPVALGDGQTTTNYTWDTLSEPIKLPEQLNAALQQAHEKLVQRKRRYSIPQ